MNVALRAATICLGAMLLAGASHAQRDVFASVQRLAQQTPGARWAIVIGNNTGRAPDVPLRFAEDDARKVHKTLTEMGGYRDADVDLRVGATATDIEAALRELARRSRRTNVASVLFYFSGHGDGKTLHIGKNTLRTDAIRKLLDTIDADVRMAVIDACKSGEFVRAKGLTEGPSFALEAIRSPSVEGTVVITSSSADEVSQESDELGGSFFTHYWVSGLYGAADKDGDGQVTLEESYRYAHFQTVNRTIQSAGGVQHPEYHWDLSGEGRVVLTDLAQKTATLILSVDSPGTYFLLDADQDLVLTEALRAIEGELSIKVPPGRYRIKKREASRVLVQEVDIGDHETVQVSDREFEVQRLSRDGADKGGLTPLSLFSALTRSVGIQRHGPEVWVGGRGFLAPGISPGPELTAGYRLSWRYAFVQPRAAVRLGTFESGGNYLHSEFDVGAAVGGKFDLGPMMFGGGLDGGVVAFSQSALWWATPAGVLPVTAQGRLFGEVGTELFEGVRLSGRTFGGLTVFRAGGFILPYPVVGAQVGAAYSF